MVCAEVFTFAQLRPLSLIDFSGSCWEWQGNRSRWGYGKVYFGRQHWRAHRLLYTWLVGPIPAGLVLDHLCRNPGCVRPDHLEVVTDAQNILRGNGAAASNARLTHCLRGHESTRQTPLQRVCLACRREQRRARWARQSDAEAAERRATHARRMRAWNAKRRA